MATVPEGTKFTKCFHLDAPAGKSVMFHDIRLSGSAHQRRVARRALIRRGIYTVHRRLVDQSGNFISVTGDK